MATKHPTIPFYFPDEAPGDDNSVSTEKKYQILPSKSSVINENKGLPSHRAAMKKLLRSWMVCAID